jgi:hypothetical protein
MSGAPGGRKPQRGPRLPMDIANERARSRVPRAHGPLAVFAWRDLGAGSAARSDFALTRHASRRLAAPDGVRTMRAPW